MLTVFPPGVKRETLQKILSDRWKIKGIPAYIDEPAALFEAFEVEGVPSSALFDAEGNVIEFFVGMPDKGKLKEAFTKVLQ